MYYGHYIHLYMRMSLKNNLYFNAFKHAAYKYKMNADKKHRDDNNQENVRQSQAPRAKVSVRIYVYVYYI